MATLRREQAAGQCRRLRSIGTSGVLKRTDVLRFLAFTSGSDIELDMLALVQGLVASALNVRVVDEDVVALLSRDETEALLGVEELHGTRCQCTLVSILIPHARDRRLTLRLFGAAADRISSVVADSRFGRSVMLRRVLTPTRRWPVLAPESCEPSDRLPSEVIRQLCCRHGSIQQPLPVRHLCRSRAVVGALTRSQRG
jgi:hypothetical protein